MACSFSEKLVCQFLQEKEKGVGCQLVQPVHGISEGGMRQGRGWLVPADPNAVVWAVENTADCLLKGPAKKLH